MEEAEIHTQKAGVKEMVQQARVNALYTGGMGSIPGDTETQAMSWRKRPEHCWLWPDLSHLYPLTRIQETVSGKTSF